ncbi:hypothetical protein G6M26_36025 [Agrobacterium tumefaciens]|nr:hypothetical protein [Agrobacterium tumefaciens]NTE23958.1 hypothetical protein [Agrobacterium tumefaciens]
MHLDELIASSTTFDQLDNFVASNQAELFDLFMWSTDQELREQRLTLENYLVSHRTKFENLPPNQLNLAFLAMLLDCSERLGLINAFEFLYNFLVGNGFDPGSRLHAASLYLIGVRSGTALVDRYVEIYELLQVSYNEEEDNSDKILITIINYYRKAIQDFGEFNIGIAKSILNKVKQTIKEDEYSFLNHPLILEIIGIDLVFGSTDLVISAKLDQYLHRGPAKGKVIGGLLIEEGTEYAKKIAAVALSINDIRRISVEKHKADGGDHVFYSLHHGTAIIHDEIQMATYMNSLGLMHFEKLREAFDKLPEALYEKRINIIDWGCGQAMGTMVFLAYCMNRGIDINVEKIILIEPSELTLARGALHINKFLPNVNYITICKLIDDVDMTDISVTGGICIHIFSNVLDMDTVQLAPLSKLLKDGCHGKNFFVVVDPYQNDLKKARIDTFVNSFAGERDFDLISTIDQRKGEWTGNWTRHERVFSVRLSG